MNDEGPWFYAWCDEAHRVDAFAAALRALAHPDWYKSAELCSILRRDSRQSRERISLDELLAFIKDNFDAGSDVVAICGVRMASGGGTSFSLGCHGETYRRAYPRSSPMGGCGEVRDVLGRRIDVAFPSNGRSISAEAAILSLRVQEDTEDILLRLCAPDEHRRATTGCLSLTDWFDPLEASGSYHAYAHEIARDVALSWVHLRDGDLIECAAGLSLEALAARVAAAPSSSSVGVAPNALRRDEHGRLDWEASKSRDTRAPRSDLARKGLRVVLPSDEELTREQVLAVLNTPHTLLLDALEAAAVPDDDWKNIQPLALEMIEAKNQGAPTLEVDVTTGHHVRFIEQHAPYHVRRLPNGGVLLATHPYRTLWQLWADALLLLGIRC